MLLHAQSIVEDLTPLVSPEELLIVCRGDDKHAGCHRSGRASDDVREKCVPVFFRNRARSATRAAGASEVRAFSNVTPPGTLCDWYMARQA